MIKKIFYSLLFITFAATVYGQTSSVDLAWDANTEPDLADYKIYKSEVSGDYSSAVTYKLSLNPAGRNPLCPDPYDPFKAECCEFNMPDLEDGKIYYFVATALDTDGNESDYSVEISHSVNLKKEKSTEQIRKVIDIEKIEK